MFANSQTVTAAPTPFYNTQPPPPPPHPPLLACSLICLTSSLVRRPSWGMAVKWCARTGLRSCWPSQAVHLHPPPPNPPPRPQPFHYNHWHTHTHRPFLFTLYEQWSRNVLYDCLSQVISLLKLKAKCYLVPDYECCATFLSCASFDYETLFKAGKILKSKMS